MKMSSQLKVILSNCLSGGTAWNYITSRMIQTLKEELKDITDLEFKQINSNTVRGEHNSFTLILTGVFYNLSIKQNQEQASKLLEYVRNAANKVQELTYAEVRIEHARTLSVFSDFEHDSLARLA
jgi:hypothetical protein